MPAFDKPSDSGPLPLAARGVRVTDLEEIHVERSAGNPPRTLNPCGPLVSYTRSDGSPPESAISRSGTRTPAGPSRYTLVELGNDSLKPVPAAGVARPERRDFTGRDDLGVVLRVAIAIAP